MVELKTAQNNLIRIELYHGELGVFVEALNYRNIRMKGQLFACPELGYYVQNGDKFLLEIKSIILL